MPKAVSKKISYRHASFAVILTGVAWAVASCAPDNGFPGLTLFAPVGQGDAGALTSATVAVAYGGHPSVLSRNGWRVKSVSSEELLSVSGAAANALDGDPASAWEPAWDSAPLPHEIVIDLGSRHDLHGFRYEAPTGRRHATTGGLKEFALYISDDTANWGPAVASGKLADDVPEQDIRFETPKAGRYTKLVTFSDPSKSPPRISIPEIYLVGIASPDVAGSSSSAEHYWRLGEPGGGPYIDALSDLHGTCSRCPTPTDGVIGGGQNFGSDGVGLVMPSSTLDWGADEEITVEAWVRTDRCESTQVIIGQRDAGSGASWALGCVGGKATFSVDSGPEWGGRQLLSGDRLVADGSWHHVAVTYDRIAGELQLYVDGQEDGRRVLVLPPALGVAGASITIGFLDEPGSARQFIGTLDEVAVRGRALSPTQIARHFEDGSSGLRLGYNTCPSVPIRIMPLGDSNTARGGYRRKLYMALTSQGYEIDFVGTEQSACDGPCSYDADHEGHAGWTPSQIAEVLPSALKQAQPDVVLVHVGTNDPDVLGVLHILDIIKAHEPRTVVVLARIINRRTYHPETSAFNRQIAALAAQRTRNGDRIRVVDQEAALLYPEDMADSLHPGPGGFEKMKNVWLEDLRRFLPACSTAAPRLTSQPQRKTTAHVPYDDYAVASGVPAPNYAVMEGPPGMTVHLHSGRVLWPSPVKGTHAVSISASNPVGRDMLTYSLDVE